MLENEIEQLIRKRYRMLAILLIILFVCYFTLPFTLAFIPEIMNQPIFTKGLSWIWLYTFLQIPMTWVLGWIYYGQAKKLDQKVAVLKQEEME